MSTEEPQKTTTPKTAAAEAVKKDQVPKVETPNVEAPSKPNPNTPETIAFTTGENVPTNFDPNANNNPQKTTEDLKNIKDSTGFGDSLKMMFEAIVGSGRFANSKDGILNRIGIALGKADGLTKGLVGTAVGGALLGFMELGDDDDDDDDSDSGGSKINIRKLEKGKDESETLAARIGNAMQNQRVSDNIAGDGVMMQNLAKISIKTQDAIIEVSNFLNSEFAKQNAYLRRIKSAVDDIEEDSGTSMLPLLAGGVLGALGMFFIGNGGTKGILELVVDSITDKVKNVLLGEDDENKEFRKGILKLIEDAISGVTKKASGFLEKWFGDPNALKDLTQNLSGFLDSITKSDKFNDILKTVKNISKSVKDLSNSLNSFNDTIKPFSETITKLLSDEEDNAEKNKSVKDESKKDDKPTSSIEKLIKFIGNFIDNFKEFEKTIEKFISIKELFDVVKTFADIINNESNKREKFADEIVKDILLALRKHIIGEPQKWKEKKDAAVKKSNWLVRDTVGALFDAVDNILPKENTNNSSSNNNTKTSPEYNKGTSKPNGLKALFQKLIPGAASMPSESITPVQPLARGVVENDLKARKQMEDVLANLKKFQSDFSNNAVVEIRDFGTSMIQLTTEGFQSVNNRIDGLTAKSEIKEEHSSQVAKDIVKSPSDPMEFVA